jgi:hypothetical protein
MYEKTTCFLAGCFFVIFYKLRNVVIDTDTLIFDGSFQAINGYRKGKSERTITKFD